MPTIGPHGRRQHRNSVRHPTSPPASGTRSGRAASCSTSTSTASTGSTVRSTRWSRSTPNAARAAADAADAALAQGRRARSAARPPDHDQGRDRDRGDPLHGRRASSSPTTCPHTTHPPSRDSRHAGAIVFGKTNLPRWSADFQTYNELFGVTSNPWDVGRTTGGSSGGAGGGGRGRLHQLRARHRHRRVGAHPGALLRCVQPQAELRCDPATRLPVARRRRDDRRRHQRVRPDRAQRRRPRAAARRARGTRARARTRVEPRSPRRATCDELGAFRIGTWLDDPACAGRAPSTSACCAGPWTRSPMPARVSTMIVRRSTSLGSAISSSA